MRPNGTRKSHRIRAGDVLPRERARECPCGDCESEALAGTGKKFQGSKGNDKGGSFTNPMIHGSRDIRPKGSESFCSL